MSLSKILVKFSHNSKKVYIGFCDSPIGEITVAADDNYLYIVSFKDSQNYEKTFEGLAIMLACKFVEEKNKILQEFEAELTAYFIGKLKKFSTPLKTFGPDFQQSVWNQLLKIPFGSTESYTDLAKGLGQSSNYSRAVGAACKANPLPIVIPCHRVVAAKSTGGFSCGVDRKKKLLEHELKYK